MTFLKNLALLFVVVVAVLFAWKRVQETGKWNQNVMAERQTAVSLQSEKAKLLKLESQVKSDEQRLVSLKRQMDQYREAGNASAHNRVLADLNRAQAVYDGHYREYQSAVSAYNRNVKAANR